MDSTGGSGRQYLRLCDEFGLAVIDDIDVNGALVGSGDHDDDHHD